MNFELQLEIKGTMPSSEKKPSRVPMWRGIQGAYIVIALCLFPIAIGGYWAYGNKVLESINLVFYFIFSNQKQTNIANISYRCKEGIKTTI